MAVLTVSAVKDQSISDDGSQAIVKFTTKYVGDLDVSMPVTCVDELIAALQKLKASIDLKDPNAATQLKVRVPKTWLVTADQKNRGLVILAFDHQAETRVGYALAPDAAKRMSASLGQNADAILNRKPTNGGSVPTS
jgi:hypothetical protein